MNEKGFTLIEMLVVGAVLIIIAMLTVPSVTGIYKNLKNTEYNRFLNDIFLSTEAYVQKNSQKYPELKEIGEKVYVYFDELIHSGFLKSTTYDPKNKKIVKEQDFTVEVKLNEDLEYEYKLYEHKVKQEYKETLLKGAYPAIDEGMIPVIIEENGTVKKADIAKEWYSYENKEWANTILVSSDVRDTYNVGDIIPENKILAYLVWIPRYKYKLFNINGDAMSPQEIEIIFENKETTKSKGIVNEEYLTHPAFTFGDKELNGIWVGKFETAGTATAPTIKPNISSLRNQVISSQFITALIFGNRILNQDGTITNNSNKETYGLTSESRMMKNTEWGAVAYLSHSKYGVNNEIRSNNNKNFTTGCGASEEGSSSTTDCQITYGKETNYPQSTTGNITGIFDMSGGAWEFVMGVMSEEIDSLVPLTGLTSGNSSEFNGKYSCPTCSSEGSTELTTGINFPDSKYYNLYQYGMTYDDSAAYNRAILGDATKETKGWYQDAAYFIYPTAPWFARGGHYAHYKGTFVFHYDYGSYFVGTSFRVVVS